MGSGSVHTCKLVNYSTDSERVVNWNWILPKSDRINEAPFDLCDPAADQRHLLTSCSI